MFVEMFSISNGYGFCYSKEYGRVFFRVEDFHKLQVNEPQPILGEKVLVSQIKEVGKNPKSFHVQRKNPPLLETGKVQSFDSQKGWGFADGYTGKYFIHKSDFIDPFIPIIGGYVSYYIGSKNGKKRACYIQRSEYE